MDNKITLREAVDLHYAKRPLRFHMPGHKGKGILGIRNAVDIDFTELPDLDNLHYPRSCIARSEELASELFGARKSFFIVNGSSAGIIAAVLALSEEGTVICARNSHVSLYRGLCLSGARPVYVMPETIRGLGICGGLNPKDIEAALGKAGKVSAVFIVSPTFEGFTSDIRKIAEITHKYNALLFVDEAHGSHFKFRDEFPETALEQGADVVIQSWHKTLAAMGQGSVLHVGSDNVDLDRLGFYLSVMQTTSPSYAIMTSLDANRELLQNEGAPLFKKYMDNLTYLRESLSRLKNIKLISGEVNGRSGIVDCDCGKIVLFLNGGGKKLEAFLCDKGIYIEMACIDYVVLMTSFADDKADYDALIAAVFEFDKTFVKSSDFVGGIVYGIPEMALTPSESVKRNFVTVHAGKAAGSISSDFITPYPPGIPLVVPGEVISKDVADFCVSFAESIDINGLLEGNYLRVLE